MGSNRKDYLISFSVLHFFDFCVQFEIQNQEPANPHKIKENEETSFVVQTQGVQIAKDVSIRTLTMDLLRDLMGDLRCAFPHGIVGDGYLILLIGVSPGSILLYDLQRILSPDRAVRRSNHINGEIEARNFRQLLCQDRRVFAYCQKAQSYHHEVGALAEQLQREYQAYYPR